MSHTLARCEVAQTPVKLATPEFRSAHLVGICGSGMKALAELLVGQGCTVTGSDLQAAAPGLAALQSRGLRIHQGHRDAHIPPDAEVVIYSPAVPADNPERCMAARLKIPQLSYSQMLGRLMRNRVGVAIAGTHGKSTTTAITATLLADAGLAPSAVIGAELRDSGRSGWSGKGPHLVVESCEYQRSFLDLSPQYAAILGVEPDHFDCFATFEETCAAFEQFAARVHPNGTLLIPVDCEAAVAAARKSPAEIITFGTSSDADWWAADLRDDSAGSRFRIFCRGQYMTEVRLPLSGRHNVLNALAAAALVHQLGVSPRIIRESLDEFPGIRRRFEEVGSWRGVTLIDDFAHHPTAVLATLQTARARFRGRKIWCAFQPHQISRTRSLMLPFAESFADADEALIVPIYAARENPDAASDGVALELSERIAARGGRSRFIPSLDRLVSTLEDEARPGDVLITMGAGDINRVQDAFTRRLQRHHAAR